MIDYYYWKKVFDIRFLTNLVYFVCKEKDEEKRLQYLYEIFSCCNADKVMKK